MRTLFTEKSTKKQSAGHCIRAYCSLLGVQLLNCLLRHCPLLCCLLFCCQLSTAQSFPVQVIAQATPPAPTNFSDFANASALNGPLRVQLVLNDFQISDRQVRLQVTFNGNGIGFQSNENVIGATPLFLEGGIPTVLDHTLLAPYFEFGNLTGIPPNVYGSPIPDGVYQVCFQVFDVLTGKRLSNNACTTINVFMNSPPILVLPENGSDIVERSPQNIMFQWTPRHINISQVEYELSLVEIWDNAMDPQAAFLGSTPLFTTTTSATTYVYGPGDPMLLPNRTYAWRVQARPKPGAGEVGGFLNQGYSQIFSFTHIEGCYVPNGIYHEVRGANQANIFWEDNSTSVPQFRVRYRARGNGNAWFYNQTTANWTTLWDLQAGTTYEYQLKKNCAVAESDWSPLRQFTTNLETEEEDLYQCGVSPDVGITNQDPLPQLRVGESFTAGDFQVVATEVHGGNGYFTGRGYTRLPYLSNIKLAVHFTNILVNTDRQLAQGTVITAFDPTMRNIVNTGEVVQTVGELGKAVGDLLEELFSQKEELLNQLAEAESFEEQQGFISQINDLEVTIDQQIDQIPNKENLPQELQDELQELKQEGSIVANNVLTPQEIADISTADAERRDRIKEIAAIAENYPSSSSFDFEITQSLEGVYKEQKLSSDVSPSSEQNVFDYEGIFSEQFEGFLSSLLIAGKYKVKIYTYNSQSEILAAIESIVPKSDEVIILMQKNTSKVLVKVILGADVNRDLLSKNITKEEIVNIILESAPTSIKKSVLFDELKRNMAGYALVAEAEAYDGNVAALIAIKLLDWGIRGIENFELPSRYFDPSANGYSALLGRDAVHNAFICGLYNGLIQEANALPGLASLLIKISASEENQAKLKAEIDQILETGILQTLVAGLVNNYNLNANGAEMVAYQFGKDVVALATMFVSFGELTKVGKVANITRLADPLQDAFGVYKLAARSGMKTTRTGSEMVLHLGDDLGNTVAKVDANGAYSELKWLDEGTVLETLKETKYIDNFGEEVVGDLTLLRKGDDVGFGITKTGDWITFIGKNIDELVEAPLGYQFYTRNEQKFIRRLDASNLNTPQLKVRDSKIVQATGKILSNADEIKLLLKTDVNKAFFWSGRTSYGVGVMDEALEIAQSKGGTTLEGILEKYKIVMPEWNSNKPSVVQLWEDVSALYANQVSGEVRAVLGRNLRPGNIWETVELPRLKQNPNVTKIYTIDPETKIEILLWKR
ncbi:hypothetical protein [Flagellimonas lutimaris]|uniref:hypothetical protein n=1 Tax=Flagellimonas lutimaris TaxID=475082 RepID=UPI003F5CC2E4